MFSLNVNTVSNVSQGLACTLIGYGMTRYISNNLHTDRCTKINLHVGVTALMLNGLCLLKTHLF